MPKFLEDRLRAEYGNDPHAIYGTMNKIGAMRGNKITAKGREMEAKHERDTMHNHNMRELRVEFHRDDKNKITGATVHHHILPKKTKSPAFLENTTESHPFSANEGKKLMGHLTEHIMGAGKAAKEGVESGGEPEGEEENEE